MLLHTCMLGIKRFIDRQNGCTIQYDSSGYQQTVEKIRSVGNALKKMTDSQLQKSSSEMRRAVLQNGVSDPLVLEAFALTAEVAERVLSIKPFDVQIIGGLVLHEAKIAEMQTGEGKTLTAVFAVYLNALMGRGVHVLTFNDYLARRDAAWMKPIYSFLGLTVGCIQQHMNAEERRLAYAADITYCTAQEAGFDFLRDMLCDTRNIPVHRNLYYAIIDEADSILIDESRIPLVIAKDQQPGVSEMELQHANTQFKEQKLMRHVSEMVAKLDPTIDYQFDDYKRTVFLTEKGVARIETLLECGNLYEESNHTLLAFVSYSLHAFFLLEKDKEYIVRNNTIELIDECTGRVALMRQWPKMLHMALEAKEQLPIQSKGMILNSITLQQFISLYPKISGMTATAQSSWEEFKEFYNLHIVIIPSNKPSNRIDYPDKVYRTKEEKYDAIMQEIIRVHATGQPIVVGTASVAESQILSEKLSLNAIDCTVLNAKNDELEASIIAQAGTLHAVTISTNMAGRGTDILLGGGKEEEKKKVHALGGLYVIGTNRFESVRIDNQLRGRAGRQGDPGMSRFFISLQDDLFITYRLKDLISEKIESFQDNSFLDNHLIRSEISRIQRIIEGQHLEIKKTLFRYTFLVEEQRKCIKELRDAWFDPVHTLSFYRERAPEAYHDLMNRLGESAVTSLCQTISFYQVDYFWALHLEEVSLLRETIHLRTYSGQNPLYEFQKIIISVFDSLQKDLFHACEQACKDVAKDPDRIENQMTKYSSSATWTYLINDNPFDAMLKVGFANDIGFSAVAGLMAPLTMLYLFFVRKKRKKIFSET